MKLVYLSILVSFFCCNTKSLNDFRNYDFLIVEDYWRYNFYDDVIDISFHNYLNTKDTLHLSASSRERIINSFFENNIEKIHGVRELDNPDQIIMPPSFLNLIIINNGERQSNFKIYYNYKKGLFSDKELNSIKKFEEVILEELEKNKKYNLLMDSITKIQQQEGIFEL